MIELVSLNQAGRHADLERRARELIQRHPRAGLVWKALAAALRTQGKDSLTATQRAAELLPQDAEAQTSLGVALWDAARVAEAISCFQRAIRIKPDDPGSHYRLGSVLFHLGRLEDAAGCYQRAAQLAPSSAEVLFGLGNILRALGRIDQAVVNFGRAVELQPGNADLHTQLGIALRLQGKPDAAEAALAAALERVPSMTAAIVAQADVHADRGQFSEAESRLRQALSLDASLPDAWVGLARLRPMTSADTAWLAGAQRALAGPVRPREAIALHYAMGKYFDDIGEYERAFEAFHHANERTRLGPRRYDREQLAQAVSRRVEVFNRHWIDQNRNGDQPGERVVFVVGMPRAGISLVEQILVAHPAVASAGEPLFWSDASRSYQAAGQQGEASRTLVALFASDYQQQLQNLLPDAARVLDKFPGNFMSLGLIHAALPGARIIHVRRNAIDTCLSIYCQDFDSVLAYANDLDDLAHYYGQYRRLMAHWRQLLPAGTLFELAYEELVADPALWTRRLVEFVALPWDPACLEFHQSDRPLTARSRWRLRQPIDAASVGSWRRYAPRLTSLLSLLEDTDASAAAPASSHDA
jgi:tetratricopeptide (TPR) repeat protein